MNNSSFSFAFGLYSQMSLPNGKKRGGEPLVFQLEPGMFWDKSLNILVQCHLWDSNYSGSLEKLILNVPQ